MEASDYFTCIAYDTVDFLVQSKYVVFGLYLAVEKDVKSIDFNSELLPHIHLGSFLEESFSCSAKEGCNVVLVMRKNDFPADVQKKIQTYTETAFPLSGNFALSVNSLISSKNIALSSLRLIPESIRRVQNACGVCAIGFAQDKKDPDILRKRMLLAPDDLLRMYFSRVFKAQTEG